ncbi:MAG: hypothetical protein DRI37_03040 [Chloroflexi bacterium]|nr:MAG: hypothetical protein DRI37_03040 [Chloroflexota bacterium]
MKSDQYWEQFAILPTDLEYLTNLLVEDERPKTLEELGRELILHRHQQLVTLAEESLSQGRIYRPGESYEVEERIIFPNLGNLLGEVVAVRPGHNPQYEPFTVVQVRMTNGDEREFAAELPGGHPLDEATYLPTEEADPEKLCHLYGKRIQELLYQALDNDLRFVTVAEQWFIKDLLMNVSQMQLNIAEAMLDMIGGGPLPTENFLSELELPAEISRDLQLFSLEYALLQDLRFDEVGPVGQALWYLRRMEPGQVLEIPAHLRYLPRPYNRNLLNEMMRSMEAQLDDEWSELPFKGELDPQGAVTVTLSYPHWRSGTLPLTAKLGQIFPTAHRTDHVRFTFVDGTGGEEFPGWVVRSGRYVYGLEEWYQKYKVGPGTYIDLVRGKNPGTIVVSTRPFRSKRGDWLRTVSVGDNTLSLEVTRYPVFCEFDELAAIGVSDPEAVDALAEKMKHVTLETLVDQVFRELAVLSLQRAVHVVTLYSVLNLLRRVPPAPLQAILAAGQQYISLGDNYWSYRGEN